MKTTLIKTLTAAALVSGAAIATQPAFAMGFKNCTNEQIRIKIYNNNDVARAIAKRNKVFGVKDYHWFKLDGDLYQVRIYRARFGKDERVHLKGGLNGGHKFSVRKTGAGKYYISTANDCAKAKPKPAPAPKPVVTIDVRPGKWIGRFGNRGKIVERLRRRSETSFTMKRKGRAPVLYTLVGKDTYQSASGSRIYVQSGNRMTWTNASGGNRITYRRV